MAKSIMQQMRTRLSWRQRFSRWLNRDPVDPFAFLMQTRKGMVARGEFTPLGTILQMCTNAGWVQFPPDQAPALGRFPDGGIDLLDPWEWDGLPARYVIEGEQCQDCAKRQCPECYPGMIAGAPALPPDLAGGQEQIAHAPHLENGERLCTAGTQITCCGGAGVIPTQDNKTCPTCNGSGKVVCRRCGGSAEISTGFQDWDEALGKSISGKLCATCAGSGQARMVIEQDLMQHLDRRSFESVARGTAFCPTSRHVWDEHNKLWCVLADTLYLGPIHTVMLSGASGLTEPWKGIPEGDAPLPYIVSHGFKRGQRAILLGALRATEMPRKRK